MVVIRPPYLLSRDTFATGVNFAIVANMNENNDYTINVTMKSRIVKSTSSVMSLCCVGTKHASSVGRVGLLAFFSGSGIN